MSAADRWDTPDAKPLSRPALLARLAILRDALDMFHLQARYDQGGAFPCLGSMKGALIQYENAIRERDRREADAVPVPTEVLLALAIQGGK